MSIRIGGVNTTYSANMQKGEAGEAKEQPKSQVKGLQKTLSEPKSVDSRLSLDIERDLHLVVAKLVKENGEVIRQVPPKERLALMRYLKETASPAGTIINKHV